MFYAASALSVLPGERHGDVFPLRERLRFRDNFGLALLELRARNEAFQRLRRGPWALFIGIAVHWQGNEEAWPSQETLGRFSGWSTRFVRDHAAALERGGFIRVRRERRADGSERIFYAPGLVTLAALAAFVERFPRDRAKPVRREAPSTGAPTTPPTIAHPPEAATATPSEEASAELRDQDQEPSSCPSFTPLEPPAQEEQLLVTSEDREVARVALSDRMKRKHPKRPAPRWYDSADVEMVARCTASVDGDRVAKLTANRQAISGAFGASKRGAPTVRFIWGKLEHFLEHVDRGGRRPSAHTVEGQRPADENPTAPCESDGRDGRVGGLVRKRPPSLPSREELAKTRAEFEQLVETHAGSPFCEYLESMAARYRQFEQRAEH
jgi:hypothetical protein